MFVLIIHIHIDIYHRHPKVYYSAVFVTKAQPLALAGTYTIRPANPCYKPGQLFSLHCNFCLKTNLKHLPHTAGAVLV